MRELHTSSREPERFVGPFRLLRRLAPTPTADVFFARREAQPALVRTISENLARNKPTVARFLDEARLLRSLKHPGIVALLDSGESDGIPYLALEHVIGPSLADVFDAETRQGGRLPVPLALRIAVDLLTALQSAHEAADDQGKPLQLVHRDLGPANVLLSRDGVVKLTGFSASTHEARSDQTGFGELRGKLAYTAPESLSGTLDARGDIFSCGVLLYELLTLSRPFDRQSEFHTLKAIREETPPPPSSVRTELPPELDELVLTALAKNPADRFESAAAMRAAIEKVTGRAKLAVSAEIGLLSGSLLPASLQPSNRGGVLDFAALIEFVGGTPIGRVEDEAPGQSAPSLRAARKEVLQLKAAPVVPAVTAAESVPDLSEEELGGTRAAPAPAPKPSSESASARQSAPKVPSAPAPRPAQMTTDPERRPIEPQSEAVEIPVKAAPVPEPRPAPPPVRPPAVPVAPVQARRVPPLARPARRQRTLASRFRAPDERGLHLVVQVVIIALFAWAGVLTVASRKGSAPATFERLVTPPPPRIDEALDTDTQVTDDDSAAPPTSRAPTPLNPEQRLAGGDGTAIASGAARPSHNGTLMVESNPPASVFVDDLERGFTPISVSLSAGAHTLNVIGPNKLAKHFRIDVPAGKRVKKVVTFPFTPLQPSSAPWPQR